MQAFLFCPFLAAKGVEISGESSTARYNLLTQRFSTPSLPAIRNDAVEF